MLSVVLAHSAVAQEVSPSNTADSTANPTFLAERNNIVAEVERPRPNLVRIREMLDAHYRKYPGATFKQVERSYWAAYQRSFEDLTQAVGFDTARHAAALRERNRRFALRGPRDDSQWTEIGPRLSNTMAGRVDVVKLAPYDAETIWIGTPTGGSSFSDFLSGHVNQHEMATYGGTLYVGNDGHASRVTNGNNWSIISNDIGIRQFYWFGISQTDAGKIVAGAQGNGTGQFSGDNWSQWLGADGMEAIVYHESDSVQYGTSQNGVFYKSTNGGSSNTSIQQPGGGDWITPYVMHPTDADTIFVGNDRVVKTTNGMQTWSTSRADCPIFRPTASTSTTMTTRASTSAWMPGSTTATSS